MPGKNTTRCAVLLVLKPRQGDPAHSCPSLQFQVSPSRSQSLLYFTATFSRDLPHTQTPSGLPHEREAVRSRLRPDKTHLRVSDAESFQGGCSQTEQLQEGACCGPQQAGFRGAEGEYDVASVQRHVPGYGVDT